MYYKIEKDTNKVVNVVEGKEVVDMAVEAVCYAIEEVKKEMKADIIKSIISIAIQEAMGQLDNRLTTIEKMRPVSNQLERSNITKTSTSNVFQGLNL